MTSLRRDGESNCTSLYTFGRPIAYVDRVNKNCTDAKKRSYVSWR